MTTTDHTLRFKHGTDPRNFTVRCICGWAYSGTYRTVRERGMTHQFAFQGEARAWNDPRRTANMPPAHFAAV
jgi:hypothetical protein